MKEVKPVKECHECEHAVYHDDTGRTFCRKDGKGLYHISEWEGCVECKHVVEPERT